MNPPFSSGVGAPFIPREDSCFSAAPRNQISLVSLWRYASIHGYLCISHHQPIDVYGLFMKHPYIAVDYFRGSRSFPVRVVLMFTMLHCFCFLFPVLIALMEKLSETTAKTTRRTCQLFGGRLSPHFDIRCLSF